MNGAADGDALVQEPGLGRMGSSPRDYNTPKWTRCASACSLVHVVSPSGPQRYHLRSWPSAFSFRFDRDVSVPLPKHTPSSRYQDHHWPQERWRRTRSGRLRASICRRRDSYGSIAKYVPVDSRSGSPILDVVVSSVPSVEHPMSKSDANCACNTCTRQLKLRVSQSQIPFYLFSQVCNTEFCNRPQNWWF